MDFIRIYTDGAARGNPEGPGGYGTIIRFVDRDGKLHERQFSQGYIKTTNNRMELMACIVGLEALNRACEVEVYSDSKYLTDAFNKHWVDAWIKSNWRRGKSNEVKNIDLWERLIKAAKPHKIKYIWVKGHAGHVENELCDKLATTAADSDDLIRDTGVQI